ncbi:BMA_0021/BMA_0022 family TOMM bacteriocin [Sorangium sp. So ce327]|jgi:ribosomally synthesized peptide (two-chain TOMM family)|uniref:BMA_0021/BMA_0022 family TOMM bacteriocin n=1 Tax=Sorangium sp. So ce327 TaxID=3133301 RepID=UPI003F62B315
MTTKPSEAWETGGTGSAAPFPRLRTAYLRAIARAWRDRDFLKQLVSASKEDPYGVLPLLEKEYGFKFPFSVKFAISDEPRPQWRPNEMLGWLADGDEIDIILPGPPTDGTPPADALALYCQWFPSMLGPPTDGTSQPPDDFGEFGVITSRLLAMTWYDEKFKEQLFASKDARRLVQASMGMIIHWNFKLKFSSLHWEKFWHNIPYQGQGDGQSASRIPARVTITVNIPQAPPDDAIWPIALAAYNDTGPQYPFTCA